MIVATVGHNGSVLVATLAVSVEAGLAWLVIQCPRFARTGSLLTLETVDGDLIYSVSLPYQGD